MNAYTLTHYSVVNCLGSGVAATANALQTFRGGLRNCDFEDAALTTHIGRVAGLETQSVHAALSRFDCRNNRLAQLALQQDGFEEAVREATEKYGRDRIAVLVGTSTSGIRETEIAYRGRGDDAATLPADFDYQHTHNVFSVADFVRSYLDLAGPAIAIATACSSSAKVFASARRWIEAGLCDAAVIGGVDTLCLTTLYGFNSLGLVSSAPCRPCDVHRDGISIGEAGGFALLEKTSPLPGQVVLRGIGESTDGYHMSTPHPQGQGAARAIAAALADADLAPEAIDYINLHGTASLSNDSAEDAALAGIFPHATPCSSTKGWTGHTLGAAGIVEAIISAICLKNNLIPGSLNTRQVDPSLRMNVVVENRRQPLQYVMSNSIGFGGNNCSLIFGIA